MEPSAAPERPHARLTRLPGASDAHAATLEERKRGYEVEAVRLREVDIFVIFDA